MADNRNATFNHLYALLLRAYGGNAELLAMAEVQTMAVYAVEWR